MFLVLVVDVVAVFVVVVVCFVFQIVDCYFALRIECSVCNIHSNAMESDREGYPKEKAFLIVM